MYSHLYACFFLSNRSCRIIQKEKAHSREERRAFFSTELLPQNNVVIVFPTVTRQIYKTFYSPKQLAENFSTNILIIFVFLSWRYCHNTMKNIKNMVLYYNQKDLVRFGEYLLSKERTNRIAENHKEGDPVSLEERLQSVYHADIENWKGLNKKSFTDLDHFCSYSGISGENKSELESIISGIVNHSLELQRKSLIAIAKVEGLDALEN